jgi:hypothetical protein
MAANLNPTPKMDKTDKTDKTPDNTNSQNRELTNNELDILLHQLDSNSQKSDFDEDELLDVSKDSIKTYDEQPMETDHNDRTDNTTKPEPMGNLSEPKPNKQKGEEPQGETGQRRTRNQARLNYRNLHTGSDSETTQNPDKTDSEPTQTRKRPKKSKNPTKPDNDQLEQKMQDRIDNLEETVNLLQEQSKNDQNELDKTRQDNEQMLKENQTLTTKLTHSQTIINQLNNQIDELHNQNDRLKEELRTEIEKKLSTPHINPDELEKLEEQNDKLNELLTRQVEITKHTEKLNTELQTRIKLLQNKIANLQQNPTTPTPTASAATKTANRPTATTTQTTKQPVQPPTLHLDKNYAQILAQTTDSPPEQKPTTSQDGQKPKVTIIGDSNAHVIIEALANHDKQRTYQLIQEARTTDELIPTMQKTKNQETLKHSDQILILMGTNNLRKNETAEKIANELVQAAKYATTTTLTTTKIIQPPPINSTNENILKQAKKLNNLLNDQQRKPINIPRTYQMPIITALKEDGYHVTRQAAKTMAIEIAQQTLTAKQAAGEQKAQYVPTPSAIPHIIGKEGKRIKAIQLQHNVKIKVIDGTVKIKGLKALEALEEVKAIDTKVREDGLMSVDSDASYE